MEVARPSVRPLRKRGYTFLHSVSTSSRSQPRAECVCVRMKGAHLKLPTKNTRYSNEPNPTLRRPPRGRGRSPRKEASSSLFGSLLNFGFLTRLGAGDSGSGARRRKEGRNEMGSLLASDSIGNKSQSPLPLFYSPLFNRWIAL